MSLVDASSGSDIVHDTGLYRCEPHSPTNSLVDIITTSNAVDESHCTSSVSDLVDSSVNGLQLRTCTPRIATWDLVHTSCRSTTSWSTTSSGNATRSIALAGINVCHLVHKKTCVFGRRITQCYLMCSGMWGGARRNREQKQVLRLPSVHLHSAHLLTTYTRQDGCYEKQHRLLRTQASSSLASSRARRSRPEKSLRPAALFRSAPIPSSVWDE